MNAVKKIFNAMNRKNSPHSTLKNAGALRWKKFFSMLFTANLTLFFGQTSTRVPKMRLWSHCPRPKMLLIRLNRARHFLCAPDQTYQHTKIILIRLPVRGVIKRETGGECDKFFVRPAVCCKICGKNHNHGKKITAKNSKILRLTFFTIY